MSRDAWEQVHNAHHKASLTHEILAAAAAYEAMKAWNDHVERHGGNVDHAKAKEFMAGAAGFFIDRIIETKGLDAIDKHRARREAGGHYENHHHHHHHRH